jgi:DinB superfamily
MTLHHTLINLKRELIRTFAVVDEWFDKPHPLHCYKPQDGGWCAKDVLEHISLASRLLLALIEKGIDKALLKSEDTGALKIAIENYTLMKDGFQGVSQPGTFSWETPEHHLPSGQVELPAIRGQLRDQLHQCLFTLDVLPNGEGALHHMTMSVNDLGELDVYQQLYFLALHTQRHIVQLKKLETEFISTGIQSEVKAS